MYLVGGYTSKYVAWSNCGSYACGDTDASSYRGYMNDVWTSKDGNIWTLVTAQAAFSGRGGHQLLVIPDIKFPDYGTINDKGKRVLDKPYLWVVGGRSGDTSGLTSKLTYYNDIWIAPISYEDVTDPKSGITKKVTVGVGTFKNLMESNPQNETHTDWSIYNWTVAMNKALMQFKTNGTGLWQGRTGHGVVLETGNQQNKQVRSLYVIGGDTGSNGYNVSTMPYNFSTSDGTAISSEVWVWRIDDPNDYWRLDFSDQEEFRDGTDSQYRILEGSPARWP